MSAKRKMPAQKPGSSEQSVGTPWEFIHAVVKRFGPLAWDLAADERNRKAPFYYGVEQDTLRQDWARLRGNLWLNPEYADLDPYAAKCARELARVQADHARRNRHDWRVLLLTPASIGTEWFHDHVHGRALVLGLSPRLTFVGHTHGYPKDLSLSIYSTDLGVGVAPWRWKE
jgi:phage N-6-adenine-methyltransferase